MWRLPLNFALKAHVFRWDGAVIASRRQRAQVIDCVTRAVDLTEAPEDAVCNLVIDLMRYCERGKIDWSRDVVSRAVKRARC
jgi:hypothetical protein